MCRCSWHALVVQLLIFSPGKGRLLAGEIPLKLDGNGGMVDKIRNLVPIGEHCGSIEKGECQVQDN